MTMGRRRRADSCPTGFSNALSELRWLEGIDERFDSELQLDAETGPLSRRPMDLPHYQPRRRTPRLDFVGSWIADRAWLLCGYVEMGVLRARGLVSRVRWRFGRGASQK